MKFEVRVPISPRIDFFHRIGLLLESLRACGGIAATAKLVVSIGDDCDPFDVAQQYPWSRGNVIWRWVDRDAFRRDSYYATGVDRLKIASDADIVLFADADVIFVAGIDDLLESLVRAPAIAGVIAHFPPNDTRDWHRLFEDANIPSPRDVYQYSGWRLMNPDPARRFTPAYYNVGAVFVPGSWVPLLRHHFERDIEIAAAGGLGFFKAQAALTLGLYRLGLRRITLEPRYNFPNDPLFDAAYPQDLRDIRILHYLRTNIVSRERDFASSAALDALIARSDLTGSNEVLRTTLAKLVRYSPQKQFVQVADADARIAL
jgi:hypothetical protein